MKYCESVLLLRKKNKIWNPIKNCFHTNYIILIVCCFSFAANYSPFRPVPMIKPLSCSSRVNVIILNLTLKKLIENGLFDKPPKLKRIKIIHEQKQ